MVVRVELAIPGSEAFARERNELTGRERIQTGVDVTVPLDDVDADGRILIRATASENAELLDLWNAMFAHSRWNATRQNAVVVLLSRVDQNLPKRVLLNSQETCDGPTLSVCFGGDCS